MRQTFTIRDKIKQLWTIFIPILITQLAMFSMSFFDIMMTGKYSADHLAGVAVGSSYWVPINTGLSGILLSVTPIVAHLIGANKKEKVPFSVLQGVYAGIAMALFIIVIGFFVLNPLLNGMNLDNEVRKVAKYYLISLSFGIVPLFVYNVLRSFIDALGKTRVTMIVTLSSLPINVTLNYILIFGKLGFPELGGIGAGIASAITYWIITFIAVWIIHRKKPFIDYKIFHSFPTISFNKWKEIFSLGVPIGLSIFIETSIFSAVTLFMSDFGTKVIAAHQAALNFSSFIYMIPLSISMALTILVGFESGAKRNKDARLYSYLGIGGGIILSLITGTLLFIFRGNIAFLYSNDLDVVDLITKFLLFGVFFQLSDAILAPIQGALRGYKDVNVTFIMALISFWVIGLPLGYVLATITELGPFGYWLGLIAGLAIGAMTLSSRLIYVQRKQIRIQKSELA
ncbi:MATE family efflux transporter [Lederbergia wuyishanensis]|uniref:Probable multidrug resistance protein NorM n=1 Tax=Lederbergia wuyishanensis TaxID=1347903 RepID=A0ABU0D0N8_9BACI|nr:MATE family efflux transporter [Lederbergia wuyishanensis]MCJ8006591.1 MATE family efflux transporter [Lederbergia wuyishanensis]MDQ0341972.1 MATE family multidrug resistance protein [Lederbergia wuyishanensis]